MITPPKNAIVKLNKENELVYISAIGTDLITFRRIEYGTFYSVPYNQKIINIFAN